MKEIQVGMLGLGTVGAGVINLLHKNQQEHQRRTSFSINITHVAVSNLTKKRDCPLSEVVLTDDSDSIVNHPDLDLIVEVIGGIEPAKSLITQAINNGKHIVTANKALIAEHGAELFQLANEKNVSIFYEAAVVGGVPIIKALREGLAANQIQRVLGILNGTSNFILSEMQSHQKPFEDVLKEAQERGYAEADPSFDIGGGDAAHKLCILASNAFGTELSLPQIHIEGIADIELQDILFAERLGYRIKHLGIAAMSEDGLDLRVHPTMIPSKTMLAKVDGVMNAVQVSGNFVGSTLFYGPGAGAGPTASSVVADLLDAGRLLESKSSNIPHLAFQLDALKTPTPVPVEDCSSSYYLRFSAKDKPGVMAIVATELAKQQISIEALLQNQPEIEGSVATIVIITNKVQESAINAVIKAIHSFDEVESLISKIRIIDLAN